MPPLNECSTDRLRQIKTMLRDMDGIQVRGKLPAITIFSSIHVSG